MDMSMIWMLLVLVVSQGWDQNKMYTVPANTNKMIPARNVNSSYELITSTKKLIVANFKWIATRPTINLDNYRQIDGIDCNEDIVVVSFAQTKYADLAYQLWSTVGDLAIMIGHEHHCRGLESVIMLSAKYLSMSDVTKISIHTSMLDIQDVLKDYELEIKEIVRPSLRKRASISSKPFHLDFNFDRELNKAKENELKIGKMIATISDRSTAMSVKLRNCYVKGDLSLSLNVQVADEEVPRYKFSLDGDIQANMDIIARVDSSNIGLERKANLANIKMPPIYVPGIFDFAPLLALDATLDFVIPEDFDLRFGYDFRYIFSLAVESMKVSEAPTTSFKHFIDVNAHSVSTSILTPRVNVTARLLPKLANGLTVFTKSILNSGLESSNVFGVSTSIDHSDDCPANMITTDVSSNHDFFQEIKVAGQDRVKKHFDGKYHGTVKCPFCKRCIEPAMNK